MVLPVLTPSAGARDTRFASFVIDAETHEVLHAVDADERRYPASLAKMMTLYLLFEAMDAGEIGLGDDLRVSRNAARQPPSRLGLKAGTRIRTLDAIKAMVVKSANDSAVVIAERLGGTEPAFAKAMTAKARALGMSETTFANASGLPDVKHATTARDMARLGEALIEDFPHYYAFFALNDFNWKGAEYTNHNGVLRLFDKADGLKTGYTRASGYNVVASAERDGARLIAVVMGGPNSRARDAHAAELLDVGFTALEDARAKRPKSTLASADSPGALGGERVAAALAPDAVVLRASQPTAQAAPQERGVKIVIEDAPPAPLAGANATPVTPRAATSPSSPSLTPPPSAAVPAAAPTPTPTPAPTPPPVAAQGGWSVQVGAYQSEERAWARLEEIQASGVGGVSAFTPSVEAAGPMWRARLYGASRSAADQICIALSAAGHPCFVSAATS